MSPVKYGKFVRSGVIVSQSNMDSIFVKKEDFLVLFSDDGLRQLNYTFLG